MTDPRNQDTSQDQKLTTEVCTQIVRRVFAPANKPTVDNVSRLVGGVSADVYRLDLSVANGPDQSVVLRAHRASHSGHPAELEYQLLTSLRQKGLPVPQPLEVDASCTTLAQPFLVIEFVAGSSEIPQAQRAQYITAMAKQLADIHNASPIGLPTLPARLDPLPELFDFLPAGSQWEALRAYLLTLSGTHYTATPKLLHGDFWPENLLWQNGAIVAVLDWEDAAIGDPLCDVAACRVELRYQLGAEAMDEFTEAYSQHLPAGTSIDAKRLALWQVYVAAAAQKYMGLWGLEPAREAHMRSEALASIQEAGAVLMHRHF